MKLKNSIVAIALLALSLHSCELLQPDAIINPNVEEQTFLQSPNAMQTWVTGTQRSFSTIIGTYAELMEILSDNYYNNYSQSSKVFDYPKLLYTDIDVTNLQRHIGTLRQAADYGLTKVAQADASTSRADLFALHYIRAYSFLLAGEHFRGLPVTDGGDIKEWKEQLRLCLEALKLADGYVADDADKAFIRILQSRVYYRLGDKANAVTYARQALALSPDLVRQVTFDGVNGVSNSIQGAVWGTWFQPLPRLDFLDPKYFKLSINEERSICIAKAEEPHLILAEASLADGDVSGAQAELKALLTLVQQRPVQTGINDQLEGRFNGGYKEYPNLSDYRVAASAEEPLRKGLVLDRQSPHLVSVPYISGTSVTVAMIESASTVDELLELVYLLRQEVFFAEGRRAADLGFRLPVCEVEAAHTPSASAYLEAVIPPFIPMNQEMDAFVMDKVAKTVVIKHNMNKVLVTNKTSDYVVPFF